MIVKNRFELKALWACSLLLCSVICFSPWGNRYKDGIERTEEDNTGFTLFHKAILEIGGFEQQPTDRLQPHPCEKKIFFFRDNCQSDSFDHPPSPPPFSSLHSPSSLDPTSFPCPASFFIAPSILIPSSLLIRIYWLESM